MADWLERQRPLILLLLVGLILAGGFVFLWRQQGEGVSLEIALPTPTVAPTELKVYVSGAVVRPGVYTLRPSDRIDDALRLAGGPTPDADLARINLAAPLRDGQQIHVPRVGEAASPLGQQRVNINTAPASLLDTLPGIGEVRAKRIVEEATKNPFRSPRDLVERKLIPLSVFEQIQDLISVD